jgi:cytochrome c biogenesis protein CcmG, thiol:disulfide interchange protein DsbE
MLKYLIPFAVFAVIVGFFVAGLGKDTRILPSTFIDKPAPAFSLPLLSDVSQKFSDRDMKGRVSLVNFWASWCLSCEQEHPVFNVLAKNTDIFLVGVNYKNDPQEAKAWLQKHGNPYHVIPTDEKGRAGIEWGVSATPETFIVDQQGMVRYKHVGPISMQILKQEILPKISQLQGGKS